MVACVRARSRRLIGGWRPLSPVNEPHGGGPRRPGTPYEGGVPKPPARPLTVLVTISEASFARVLGG